MKYIDEMNRVLKDRQFAILVSGSDCQLHLYKQVSYRDEISSIKHVTVLTLIRTTEGSGSNIGCKLIFQNLVLT